MPILWKLVLKKYTKYFSQSLVLLVAIQLAMASANLGQAILFGSTAGQLCLHFAYHICNLFHWTVGICSVIAVFFTFYQLYTTGEISALRTSGIGLSDIERPIIVVGVLLSIFTFCMISEICPVLDTKYREFNHKIALAKPLPLIQQRAISGLNNSYVTLHLDSSGTKAVSPVIIQNNEFTNRLILYTAAELCSTKQGLLLGKNATVLSHFPVTKGEDHTFLQNFSSLSIDISQLAPTFSPSYHDGSLVKLLPLKLLPKIEPLTDHANGWKLLIKRLSYGLYPLSLSLLGASFGRIKLFNGAEKRILVLLFFFLGSSLMFLLAKYQTFSLSLFFYLFPHLLLWIYPMYERRQLDAGIR